MSPSIGKDDDSTGGAKGFKIAVNELKADTVKANGLIYRNRINEKCRYILCSNNNGLDTNDGNNPMDLFRRLQRR